MNFVCDNEGVHQSDVIHGRPPCHYSDRCSRLRAVNHSFSRMRQKETKSSCVDLSCRYCCAILTPLFTLTEAHISGFLSRASLPLGWSVVIFLPSLPYQDRTDFEGENWPLMMMNNCSRQPNKPFAFLALFLSSHYVFQSSANCENSTYCLSYVGGNAGIMNRFFFTKPLTKKTKNESNHGSSGSESTRH